MELGAAPPAAPFLCLAFQEHRVAIAEEAIFRFDRVLIGLEDAAISLGLRNVRTSHQHAQALHALSSLLGKKRHIELHELVERLDHLEDERRAAAAEAGGRVQVTLVEDLRTAITLRELEGLTYEEIAQAMDCPIGTVRSRIFRAREAIDAKLKPLMATE